MAMRRREFVQGLGSSFAALGGAWAWPGRVFADAGARAAGAQLPRSEPQAQGVSPAGISQFLDAVANAKVDMHSFMLVRHGQVVSEGWWAPYRRDAVQALYSLSKSFTSTAVGLAVSESRLQVSDAVVDFFPEQVPARVSENLAALQVKHLLTMSVGHKSDSVAALAGNPKEPDWVRTFLSLPIENVPGSVFLYDTGASFMLSAIVQKATGQKLIDYLQPRLFGPLQISEKSWQSSPLGINTGGWGLSVTTETLAKFGQLYLQKGQWNGKPLLPAAWVEEATSVQIQQPATWNSGAGPEAQALHAAALADPVAALKKLQDSSDWYQGYGYQFWRCRHNAFRGDGAFGQFCLVMPDEDAVLAITSETSDMQGLLNLVWEHLLPAMQGNAAAATAAAARRNYSGVNLRHRLETLRLPLPAGGPNAAGAAKVNGKLYKLESNTLGARSVSLDFDDAGCTFSLTDAAGRHQVHCGLGQWLDGTTNMPGEPPGLLTYDAAGAAPPQLKVAAAGAWSDANTFEMVWRFYETPHHDTITCRFGGNQIAVTFLNSITALFGDNTAPHPEGRPVLKGSSTA